MKIKFNALDYTSEDTFVPAEYEFEGDKGSGWELRRNGENYLSVGQGYELLKTRMCGVCSTDLARRFLPFPLPQVTGHEVVAESLDGKRRFVVEINDTTAARGDENPDRFWKAGVPTHEPDRMVLGIDRLPGGFGAYILAPQNAVIPFHNISDSTAVLIEPFAAALQAVTCSPPRQGDRVAVLGPRRLGSLILAALRAFRNDSGTRFAICALARHDHLLELGRNMGADEAVDLRKTSPETLEHSFDIVYDTTSTPEGFGTAMRLAKREVHLKSTNGQEVFGIKKMTEVVVDELSILPFTPGNVEFKWAQENRRNQTVYVAPGVKSPVLPGHFRKWTQSAREAQVVLDGLEFHDMLPRFDLGIASTVEEIDAIIRPNPGNENSLVRPRGAILFQGDTRGNRFLEFIASGKNLRASRCGDFHLALRLLEGDAEIAQSLEKFMITHRFPSTDLPKAFQTAKDSSSIKVIVEHK